MLVGGSFVGVLALLLIVGLFVLVGVLVYKDAERRGMHAALWTAVVLLVPSLIGFIVYLVARAGHPELECAACKAHVKPEYAVCPQCGVKLRAACDSCGAVVEEGWQVCPQCATPLPETQTDVQPPKPVGGFSVWKIVLALVVIPVVIFAVAMSYSATGSGGSKTFAVSYMDEYVQIMQDENMSGAAQKVMARVDEWRHFGEQQCAYGLQYVDKGKEGYVAEVYTLVYIRGVGLPFNGEIGSATTLFSDGADINIRQAGNDELLVSVLSSGNKAFDVEVKIAGQKVPCTVYAVEYNPTIFVQMPRYMVEITESVSM